MTELSIEERVARGAAWLDRHEPGWVDDIDLDVLDIEDCSDCVLGQLFGDYCTAPDDAKGAKPDRELALMRGFNFDDVLDPNDGAELTAEWRRLIESRRAAVS